MGQLPQQLFNCLEVSSLLALIALGLTLVYALSGIVNFAQGDIMMLGGYIAISADALGFAIAALVALVGTAIIGVVLERAIFRFTLSRPINGFIVSLGIIAVLENGVSAHYGTNPMGINAPFAGVANIGSNTHLPTEEILTIVVSACLLAAFFAVQRYTRWGRALRALAENRKVAELMGIRSGAYRVAVFAIGSGMAGVAGVLIAAQNPITPEIGASYIVSAFAVVLVGGLGSATGIVAGSLILGALETFTPGSILPNQWEPVLSLVVIIGVLLIRPRGLFRGVEGAELR
jgi:branched-chain amino acid transport system permease protein